MGGKFELAETPNFGNFVSHFTLSPVNRQLRSQPPATFLNTGRRTGTNPRNRPPIGNLPGALVRMVQQSRTDRLGLSALVKVKLQVFEKP